MAVAVIAFLAVMANLVPGDPIAAIMGTRATPELRAQARSELHLDDPVPEQVALFVEGVLQGNLGNDFITHESVTTIVGRVLPHTIVLAFSALLFASLLGIPLGVVAATRSGSWIDHITAGFSISLITTPTFVLSLVLLLIFAVWLRLLPAIGAGNPSDPADYLTHLILPTVALGAGWVGYLARLMRASMLEVLGENHIRTARSLGVSERRISYYYALKNAVIPTVAILGVGLGSLMGGALFVEVIFARPGLGSTIVDAVNNRNFPVVRGGVVVASLIFVLVNLGVDLSFRLLDPRIRVEGAQS